jgi:hypothetical protein
MSLQQLLRWQILIGRSAQSCRSYREKDRTDSAAKNDHDLPPELVICQFRMGQQRRSPGTLSWI